MSDRVHFTIVAVIGLVALAGLALWSRWGALIWISNYIGLCG
jgi:hypothetical protein